MHRYYVLPQSWFGLLQVLVSGEPHELPLYHVRASNFRRLLFVNILR